MHDHSSPGGRLRNQSFPGQAPIPALWNANPLLTAKEAANLRRQGLSTFWRHVKQGLVPKPIYIAVRSPRWHLSDLCPTRTQQGSQA